MTKNRLVLGAARCDAMRRGGGRCLALFQSDPRIISGLRLRVVHAQNRGPQGGWQVVARQREKGSGRWKRGGVVAGPSGVVSVGSFDCWLTYRVDALHQAVVKPRRSAWW